MSATGLSARKTCSTPTSSLSDQSEAMTFSVKQSRLSALFSWRPALLRCLVLCLALGCLVPAGAQAAARNMKKATKTRPVSLETMAGQMILAGFRGTGARPQGQADRALAKEYAALLKDIRQGRLGGVILFDWDAELRVYGRNIVSVEQVAALSATLQKAAKIPLFIAIDQEGGRVARLLPEHGMPLMPSAKTMALLPEDEVERLAEKNAKALARAGINLNFAPSLDVDVNPQSPAIGAVGRSFSADEHKVARYGAVFARGQWQAGVVSAFKHFPGHGSARSDTHLGIADITDTWEERELFPFTALREAPVPSMVMVAHVMNRRLDRHNPATLSHPIVTGLLRTEIGWQGVVVTDDLQMGAITTATSSLRETVRRAVLAGSDILLFGNNMEHDPELVRKVHGMLVELVRGGEIPEERIAGSYERIMRLKATMASSIKVRQPRP